MFKNLALRRKDAEIFSVDSEDQEIAYNLTKIICNSISTLPGNSGNRCIIKERK